MSGACTSVVCPRDGGGDSDGEEAPSGVRASLHWGVRRFKYTANGALESLAWQTRARCARRPVRCAWAGRAPGAPRCGALTPAPCAHPHPPALDTGLRCCRHLRAGRAYADGYAEQLPHERGSRHLHLGARAPRGLMRARVVPGTARVPCFHACARMFAPPAQQEGIWLAWSLFVDPATMPEAEGTLPHRPAPHTHGAAAPPPHAPFSLAPPQA
jgi:hypothetical protein